MLPEITVAEALDIIETVMSAQNVYNPTTIAALHHARRALAENVELRAAVARAEKDTTGLPARLATHYLAQIVCDHDRKMDNPICACSRVNLGWHPSVGAAVAAWVDHALAADVPAAQVCNRCHERPQASLTGLCEPCTVSGGRASGSGWADVPAAAAKTNLCGSCDAGLPMSCTCPDVPAAADEVNIGRRVRTKPCGCSIHATSHRNDCPEAGPDHRAVQQNDGTYALRHPGCDDCAELVPGDGFVDVASPAVLPPTPNDDNGESEGECGSCGGDRWVDDENWQPEDYERAVGRVIGSGRIPCGICNHGGWSVPDGATERPAAVVGPVTLLIHIVGPAIQVGPQLRQRCAWCGATLLDYNLERVMVPTDQPGPPATWPDGELLAVDGNASYTVAHKDGDQLPDEACARIDAEVTR